VHTYCTLLVHYCVINETCPTPTPTPFPSLVPQYATAARQCVDLGQHLLMALPPSSTFLQRFFSDEGFSMDVSGQEMVVV